MGSPDASQPRSPPSRNATSTPCSASFATSSLVCSPERQYKMGVAGSMWSSREPPLEALERHVDGAGDVGAPVDRFFSRVDEGDAACLEELDRLLRLDHALSARQVRIDHRAELGLPQRADFAADRATLHEDHERRDRLHAQLAREHRRSVDVDRDDLRLTLELVSERLELGRDGLAGAAPFSAEFNQDG